MAAVPTAVRPAYLDFRVYAALDYGESLVVVGSTLVLGKDEPDRGIALTTSSTTYPVWEVDKVPVFPKEDIQYRYAIYSGGSFSRWEDGDDETHRKVVVKPDELPPLPDGSPSRTLTVADRLSTPGLLEWGDLQASQLANTACSFDAVVADSKAYAAKEKDNEAPDPDTLPERRPLTEEPKQQLFSSSLMSEGVPYLTMAERNAEFELAAEAARLREAEKDRRRRAKLEKQRKTTTKAAVTAPTTPLSEQPTRPPSPRSSARLSTASAALQAFLEEEARPPGVESPPLTASDGVVVASLFLPVLVKRIRQEDKETDWDIEWDLENLLSLQAPLRVTRIGLARVPDDTTQAERHCLSQILRRAPWHCIAIFIDRETYNGFYHTFCKGVLWPVFHNSLEVYGEKATPSLEFDDAPFVSGTDDDDNPDDRFWASSNEEGAGKGSQTTHAPSTLLAAVGSAHDLDAAVKKHQSMETFSDMGEDDAVSPDALEQAFKAAQITGPQGGGGGPKNVQVSPLAMMPPSPPTLSPVETPSAKPLGGARKRTTKIDRAWRAYKRVNQIFREHVVEAYNEGDLIWIHGFQLALLPAFVSRRLTVAKVGLFLHTPFPSSEIFRTLSMRAELLRGMLSADQVGFHLYEYARHFLTTARRLLGARYSFDARGPVINVDGRDVVISCMHAGVEPADLAGVATTDAGVEAVRKLRKELGLEADDDPTHFDVDGVSGKQQTRIIAGIDKLERLRGLPLKLLAYERFLDARAKRLKAALDPSSVEEEEEPEEDLKEDEEEVERRPKPPPDPRRFPMPEEKKEKKKKVKPPKGLRHYQDDVRVVLVQYALSSVERNEDCERTRRDSMILCDRIRKKHGDDCLVWREVVGLDIVDRLALLKIADIFWVSSVRDGLNRWPLEYVAMQSDNLLGVERHMVGLARDEDVFLAEKCSEAPAEVAGPYFDDLNHRMTYACDGMGNPAEDPCSVFAPKMSLYIRQKRKRLERRKPGPMRSLTDAGIDEIAMAAAKKHGELIHALPKDVEEGRVFTEDPEESLNDDFEDLADETFPSPELIDEDERFAAACERRARTPEGAPLFRPVPESEDEPEDEEKLLGCGYEDRNDYLIDAQGKKYVVTDLTRRSLSRRSRRILRRYLASGDEAKRQHAARHARARSRRLGALLLSENASATRVLLGAAASNPWRIDESAEALESVIAMKSRERMSRHALDADFLARCTTAKWAYRVLHDLKAMRKDANRLNATHAGLGLNFRVIGMRSGFDALQVQTVAKAYREAGRGASSPSSSSGPKRGGGFFPQQQTTEQQPAPSPAPAATRTIVLDYGGTLVPDAAAATIDSVSYYAIAQGERMSPTPSPEVKQALTDLANDPRNVVFVVSGRERADLMDALGDVIDKAPDLGLAAEHGFFVRWPRALRQYGGGGRVYRRPSAGGGDDAHSDDDVVTKKERALSSDAVMPVQVPWGPTTAIHTSPAAMAANAAAMAAAKSEDLGGGPLTLPPPQTGHHTGVNLNDNEWERPFSALSDDLFPWRDAVLTTMDSFTQRTQGTYIEKHESSLVWQYRDADPDYGEMQAKELENQLGEILAPFPTKPQILRGENPSAGGYVEVRPAGVDKGAFLNRLLRVLSAAGRPADFALVVGDDESDEPMFRALANWTKDRDIAASSVCIGKKPSEAESYVDSHDSLLEILQALARISSRSNRYYSAVDLTHEGGHLRPLSLPPTVDDDDDARTVAVNGSGSGQNGAPLELNQQQSAELTSSFLRGVRSLSMPVRLFFSVSFYFSF